MIHPDSPGLPLSTTADLAAGRFREGFDLAARDTRWPGLLNA